MSGRRGWGGLDIGNRYSTTATNLRHFVIITTYA